MACEQFSGAMSTGAEDASDAFTSWVNSIGAESNLSAFALFPSGVAGVTNPGIETLPMPTTTSDVLIEFKDDLEQYTDVLNQFATLGNRASFLSSAVATEMYNPADTELMLDLTGALDSIEVQYASEKSAFIENLSNCLSASATTVDAECQAVSDNAMNEIKTAYDWYKANNGTQLLLQNTIALQYAGTLTNNNSSEWPLDVVYIDPLPSWDSVNEFVLIGGQAALVGFADAAYVNDGTTEQTSSLAFLPLEPTADLSEILTEVFTTQDTSPPGLWFGWLDNEPSVATNDKSQPLAWLGGSDFCSPTAEDPCEIWFGIESSLAQDYPLSFRMNAIKNLFPTTGD
jgi:hypothetical protein